MSCNIFDVVPHPSLFQQQHAYSAAQSAQTSDKASAPSTVYIPLPPSSMHTDDAIGHAQWNGGEWAEGSESLARLLGGTQVLSKTHVEQSDTGGQFTSRTTLAADA
ncbi:hypothetical protein IW140_004928 [Coemansia sp. RSA 1813]|nr:hypothetical protein EV178_005221 [Coemansia sp. RSA 1646]KAJ2566459.1 hypothetical protein IW140_004928 [Coemansia sp. RSA 1813]